jgi:hypothetical protein
MSKLISYPLYSQLANHGKNSWWRFILSILVTLTFYMIGALSMGFIAVFLNDGIRPKIVYSEQSDPHSEQTDPPCREANPEGLPEGQFG